MKKALHWTAFRRPPVACRCMEASMLGRAKERWQEDLFVSVPLRDMVPADHILRRVDGVLDLSWLRGDVASLYDATTGRPSVDPEVAVRLMLSGILLGMRSDRQLMREARVNLAILWFCGFRPGEALPDHSSLTRFRQRLGADGFERIFRRVVECCVRSGLVRGDFAHVDATLVRADASLSRLRRELEPDDDDPDPPPPAGKSRESTPSPTRPRSSGGWRSETDPDARMARSSGSRTPAPCYKQHQAVDDHGGIIVDVAVTTGEASEGKELAGHVERFEAATGVRLSSVTGDRGYAHGENFTMLESRGIEALIPTQGVPAKPGRLPLCLFKYDARHGIVRCPEGKVLVRGRSHDDDGWEYRARTSDCASCPRRAACVPPSALHKRLRISDDHEALLRARRKDRNRSGHHDAMWSRHRNQVEGLHGEAKQFHGLARARRRGLWNMRIQSYLTATAMNLKRMAAALSALAGRLLRSRAASERPDRTIVARIGFATAADETIRRSRRIAA